MLYIKELRLSTGLSQSEFAKAYNIPVSTLRKWEQNESNPPKYVVSFIEKSLPFKNNKYQIYLGNDGKKYYLDRNNRRIGDSRGNWISFTEDIEGVVENNIGIYAEDLFKKYYQAIEEFDYELKFDKINKIKWR